MIGRKPGGQALDVLCARGMMLFCRGLALVLVSMQLSPAEFATYALVLSTWAITATAGAWGAEPVHVFLAGRRIRRAPLALGSAGRRGGPLAGIAA